MKPWLLWVLIPIGLLAQSAAVGGIVFLALSRLEPASVTQDRAWIEPQSIMLRGPIKSTKPIELEVAYANVGKAVALDAMGRYQIQVVSAADFDKGSADKSIEADQICRDVRTKFGAGVVYPSATRRLDFTFDDPRYADRLNSGDNALVFEMCISYRTLSKVHHTAFCYYYRPHRQSALGMDLCLAGQHAD